MSTSPYKYGNKRLRFPMSLGLSRKAHLSSIPYRDPGLKNLDASLASAINITRKIGLSLDGS